MSFINLYRILQISTYATAKDVKVAYRRLAKIWHPDRNYGSKDSEEKFKEILSAYQTLSDPYKRRKYDALYKEQLAEEESNSEANIKPDFTWQSAEAYRDKVNHLWKQYEALKKDRSKPKEYNSGKTKYYYYNNQKITEEEFKAQTNPHKQSSRFHQENTTDPRLASYEMDSKDWKFYKNQMRIENFVIALGALFFYSVILSLYPKFWGAFLGIAAFILAFFFLKSWANKSSLEHLIIDIYADRVIRRGKGLLETTIYFDELAEVRESPSGIFIHKLPHWNELEKYTRDIITSDKDVIFIPVAIQNYEIIRTFFMDLNAASIS